MGRRITTFSPLFALFVWISPALTWAGTITVGPPGSGADFPEIQDAVDAAAPGDTLLVLPGSYSPFAVGKPLSILGDGSQTVFVTAPTAALECSVAAKSLALEISGLSATDEVFLSGMTIQTTAVGVTSQCELAFVHDNLGTVALHDLVLAGNTIGVQIERSSLALLESVSADQLQGTSGLLGLTSEALVAEDSSVWVMNSSLAGGGSPDGIQVFANWAGIKLTNSSLYIARSTVLGGRGSQFIGACIPGGIDPVGTSGKPAIEAFGNSVIKIVGGGGANKTIKAGDAGLGNCQFNGADGIQLDTGTQLLLQSDVVVLGGQGDPPGTPVNLNGGLQVDLAFTYPSLESSASVVGTGSNVTLTLDGNASASGMLYLSLGIGPITYFPGVDGAAATNAAASILLANLLLDSQGGAKLALPIPPLPGLVGLVGYFQFLEVGGPQMALSNPTFVSIAR